ncbi:ATP-binding cassette domain-containing protein [Jannaschia sp. R86511]|uniref:ABC transporter ATP-binding protein n=1 Tax=Jannaschia sp. R86511 TaxID=3093853 RepID=UPI0036D21371
MTEGGEPGHGLRVRGLCRRYDQVDVLRDWDLDVAPGQVVVLVGGNGAGKSTALRCVVGADRPDAGEVELDGRPLEDRSPASRRAVASSLDDADLLDDLTVREHLDLLARAHGVPHPDGEVDAALAGLDLADLADRLPATLSSGQRRRVLLAATAVRPCRLLVLDEPEQRLDAAGLRWLRQRLRTVAGRGAAVLVASHEPGLAADVGGREVRLGA